MPASDQWGDDSLHDLLSLSPAPKGVPTLHEGHIRVGHSRGVSTGTKFTAPAAVGMGLGGDGASGQAEEQ